jgi:rhodanese-related sulfurtransferase
MRQRSRAWPCSGNNPFRREGLAAHAGKATAAVPRINRIKLLKVSETMKHKFNPRVEATSSKRPLDLSRRTALHALASLVLTASLCSGANAQSDSVNLDVARTELDAGRTLLIDVREPEEHAAGVAAGARLLPLSQLTRRLAEIPNDSNKPVLLICRSQNRSGAALKFLREHGYGSQVRFVHGGMAEWARRGFPMVKPGN